MMIKIFFFMHMLLLLAPYSLCAMHMHKKPLTTIDQILVHRDIMQRGISAVETENRGGCLRIQDSFFPQDVDSDPSSKTIFSTIEKIESESEYHPEPVKQDEHYFMPATNLLGNYTRYYWQNRNRGGAFVTVISKISHKEAVKQILDQEKTQLSNAIHNNKK